MTDRSLLEMTQVQQTVNTAQTYEGGVCIAEQH